MKIAVLVENTAVSSEFEPMHGLSFYIETGDHKILFDLGQNGLFRENASRLGIRVGEADMVVISHGHYDHGGGLLDFMEENIHAGIYIRAAAFAQHYSKRTYGMTYIGLNQELKKSGRLIYTGESQMLDDEMRLFSCLDDRKAGKGETGGLYRKSGQVYEPDTFEDEQSLLIREGEKLVLFAGCAHNGIVRIIEEAGRIAGKEPTHVFAGFHLKGCQERAHSLAEELRGLPALYFTGHCTGEEACGILEEELGGRLQRLAAGKVFYI